VREQEFDLARGRREVGIRIVDIDVRVQRLRRGRQLAEVDQLFRHAREVAQDVQFFLVQRARHAVQYAQGPQRHAVDRVQLHARIKAHVRRIDHHRVVGEARILRRIRDDQWLVVEDRVAAERDLAARARHVDAAARLEPLVFLGDERDQRDRHLQQPARHARDAVEGVLRGAVEEAGGVQRRQPARFVERYRWGLHVVS